MVEYRGEIDSRLQNRPAVLLISVADQLLATRLRIRPTGRFSAACRGPKRVNRGLTGRGTDDSAQSIFIPASMLHFDVVAKVTIVGDVADLTANPGIPRRRRARQTAMAGSTSGSRPRPAPMKSIITAAAINSIPEKMNASK